MFLIDYLRVANPEIENKKREILPVFGKLSGIKDTCHSAPAYLLLKCYKFQFLVRYI